MADHEWGETKEPRGPSLRERLSKAEALMRELSDQIAEIQRHIGDLQDEVGMREPR